MTIKKRRRNGAGWNKGRSQGVKTHFTAEDVEFLIRSFVWEENYHDLALFTVAIDTALRACDLLNLRVQDVSYSNGQIRQKLAKQQQKTSRPVEPVLTSDTQKALATWIKISGKNTSEFLFTRTKLGSSQQRYKVRHRVFANRLN